jgi:hypothetical protein
MRDRSGNPFMPAFGIKDCNGEPDPEGHAHIKNLSLLFEETEVCFLLRSVCHK